MINRKFTFWDNLFLLCFLLLLIIAFCYICVKRPLCQEFEDIRGQLVSAEDRLEIQRHVAERKEIMENLLKQELEKGGCQPGAYDNMASEIKELSQVLSAAKAYDINVFPEELSDLIARRDILISYRTDSYGEARDILESIENTGYFCIVKEVELVTGAGNETGSSESVYGKLLVTYYETLDRESRLEEDGAGEDGVEGWDREID